MHINLFITDDETTPPGTPPPPYKTKSKSTSDTKHPMLPKRNYFQSSNTQPCANDSVQNNLSEQDDFLTNEITFNTSTSSAASYGANISATQANILQRQIISMEDDELVDDQENSTAGKFPKMLTSIKFSLLFILVLTLNR